MTQGIGGLWDVPVLVAPMAGGPTTPQLVAAGCDSGGFAFVAGAYRSAAQVEEDIRALRGLTPRPFGVNVFCPGPHTADVEAVQRYVDELIPEAERLGVELGRPTWDDDDWHAKLALLIDTAPAVSSFAFGCPEAATIAALQRSGSLVMVTVTNADEASLAVERGVDVLCAQGIEAGAHRGTFDDTAADDELTVVDLVAAIATRHRVPIVAAGGISTPARVEAAFRAGAVAVQAGTAFLRADESGASEIHQAALVDPRFSTTAMTRAFTGRRARGLVNAFLRRHPEAPSAFPEIHYVTRPLRVAATRLGDADSVNLWAGTGHRDARAEPAAAILDWLASGVPSS